MLHKDRSRFIEYFPSQRSRLNAISMAAGGSLLDHGVMGGGGLVLPVFDVGNLEMRSQDSI